MRGLSILVVALVATTAAAQITPDEALKAIQDNSFLLEEAYNQGPGVVQHISAFVHDFESDEWSYTFTQEWPLFSQKHQWSYSIPIESSDLGDIALNYRYQLVGDADANLAISPRFSVILPTSDDGDNDFGLQLGLPVSRVLAPRLIAHTNLGVTWFSGDGDKEWSAGQSVIYAASTRMHLMLEGTYTRANRANAFVVSPAIRWAFNLPSGMQVVPGIGVPIGFGDDDSRAVLLYLSFEK